MIAIPNMEKPKDCIECPLKPLDRFGYPYCIILKRHTIREKLNDCPLIEIVRCGECKKVDTKKCPMYSAGWGYTNDDWCSEGERSNDE